MTALPLRRSNGSVHPAGTCKNREPKEKPHALARNLLLPKRSAHGETLTKKSREIAFSLLETVNARGKVSTKTADRDGRADSLPGQTQGKPATGGFCDFRCSPPVKRPDVACPRINLHVCPRPFRECQPRFRRNIVVVRA